MISWFKSFWNEHAKPLIKPRESDAFASMSAIFTDKMTSSEVVCRTLYLKNETKDHKDLRLALDSAMAILVMKMMQMKVRETGVSQSYQVGLSASYLRTHHVLTTQLQNGNLIESIVLARKQMESLARFTELDLIPYEQLKKKTPNIGRLKLGEVGRTYGFMSEHAHFSDIHTTEILGSSPHENPTHRSPHVFPSFQVLAYQIFEAQSLLNLYFLSAVISKLTAWDPDLNIDEVVRLGEKASRKAVEIGFLRICPPPKDAKGDKDVAPNA